MSLSVTLLLSRRDSFSRDVQLISLPRHMDWLLNGLYRENLVWPIWIFSSTNRNSLNLVTVHPWYVCKHNWLCKAVIYKVFKKNRNGNVIYTGEASTQRLTFYRLQVILLIFFSGSGIWYSRISCRISLVVIYEWAGERVILVGKKTQGLLDEFYGSEKSRKRSGFVFYSYFQDSEFTQLQQLKGWQVPK